MGCARCCSRCPDLREEFRVKNLRLQHIIPLLFVRTQWGGHVWWISLLYMLYRVALPAYTLTWIGISADGWRWETHQWFIFLTHWSYVVLTISLLWQLGTALHWLVLSWGNPHREYPTTKSLPWYLKVQWLLFNVAAHFAFCVTALYYIFLFDGDGAGSALDFAVHAANSIIVGLDLVITATPIRILHIYHGYVYGIIYVAFSAIYYGADGKGLGGSDYIYDILDWTKPGDTVLFVFLAAITAVPITWAVVYVLYRLRVLVNDKCCSTTGDVHLDSSIGGSVDSEMGHVNSMYPGAESIQADMANGNSIHTSHGVDNIGYDGSTVHLERY